MPPRDPLEYQPQQQGMVVVVLEALPRGTFDPGQTEGGPTEVRRVVRARLVIREEEEPAAVVDARRHHEKVPDRNAAEPLVPCRELREIPRDRGIDAVDVPRLDRF